MKTMLVGAAVIAFALSACSKQEEGPAESAGKQIDAAMQDAAQKSNDAAAKAAEAMSSAAQKASDAAAKASQQMQDTANQMHDDGHP